MNKNELKKILKPLIKECIKEVLFEEKGVLSHVISEVANSFPSTNNIVNESSQRVNENLRSNNKMLENEQKRSNQLKEQKKKLLDAIGKSAYGGIDLFEGTEPAPAPTSPNAPQGALSGVNPQDPGVDISSIFGSKSSVIFERMMGKK